jgi:hypothetical protein
MNEFGEPNMGNPSVRFDEGRERVGHWPLAFQPILSRLLYNRRYKTGFKVLMHLGPTIPVQKPISAPSGAMFKKRIVPSKRPCHLCEV